MQRPYRRWCRPTGLSVSTMSCHRFPLSLHSLANSPARQLASADARRHQSTTSTSSSSASPPPPSAEEWAAALPDVPYGFPNHRPHNGDSTTTHLFEAEQSGGLQKAWLQELPRRVASSQVRTERYLPAKDEFWQSPPYEALREVVLRTAYHDALKILMEHDYTFLFADVMCNDEAPMPHVLYEDFMQALTFASRQRPPEEQFALPDDVLRDLLCWAAYYCTLDPFYYTSAALLFHKVEQEQHLSPATHSAWVYICAAAGKLDEALAYAAYMAAHDIPFDPAVFAFMLHPSLTPVQLHLHHAPQTSKGVVLQRRLCSDMQQHHGTTAVAVHALFIYHVLTLRHTRKWEVLRAAAELRVKSQAPQPQSQHHHPLLFTAMPRVLEAAAPAEVISSRTMQLALSLFSREKGVRWGPRTTKAMVSFMLAEPSAGATTADVVFALMRVRRNERTAMLAALPRTVFSEAEREALMQTVLVRSRSDPTCAVAAPLLRELFAAGGGDDEGEQRSARTVAQQQQPWKQHGSDAGITRAWQDLQRLAASSPDSASNDAERRAGSTALSSTVTSTTGTTTTPDAEDESPAAYSLTSSFLTEAAEVALPNLAKAARELLEAVQTLDRESAQYGAERKTANASTTTVRAAAAEVERLAALQASMEAMGTSASLSAWSLQQVEREAEETRLRAQINTAWIAPTYQP